MKTVTTTGNSKMDKPYYIISDAAKELHVESHVLRYWEEELGLKIPRNNMGHRIYGNKEMELFRQIIEWKKEGLSLKDIHDKCNPSGKISSANENAISHHQVIPYPVDSTVIDSSLTEHSLHPSTRESSAAGPSVVDVAGEAEDNVKMIQFKQILGRIVTDAIRDNSDELTTDIANNVSEHVNKELDYLFREKEDADEKRYRQLDETIRNFQRARQEAAATEISEYKSKRKSRRKNRNEKKNPV